MTEAAPGSTEASITRLCQCHWLPEFLTTQTTQPVSPVLVLRHGGMAAENSA